MKHALVGDHILALVEIFAQFGRIIFIGIKIPRKKMIDPQQDENHHPEDHYYQYGLED